jgi:adenosylcobinamide kinase / adenosylcobinamide-phosphate guanylyltransferase
VILITGGARSGKSVLAERLAAELAAPSPGRVLYVATAEPRDEEMAHRIEHHQAHRPRGWGTLEAPRDAIELLRGQEGGWDVLLFDCLTLYTTNFLLTLLGQHGERLGELGEQRLEEQSLEHLGALATYLAGNWPRSVVVTNEVGSGIVPDSPLGRLFRDVQGRVNQAFAHTAAEVYLCVSGIPLRLKP